MLTYRKLIKASVGLHKGVRVRAADLDARELPRQDVARAVEPYRISKSLLSATMHLESMKAFAARSTTSDISCLRTRAFHLRV
jgi:hypothetical protein